MSRLREQQQEQMRRAIDEAEGATARAEQLERMLGSCSRSGDGAGWVEQLERKGCGSPQVLLAGKLAVLCA
eukprot:gene2538-1184_t